MIWFAIWLVGVILTLYPVAHFVTHDMASRPGPADWACGALVGSFAAALWPLFLAGAGLWLVSRRIWAGTWKLPRGSSPMSERL